MMNFVMPNHLGEGAQYPFHLYFMTVSGHMNYNFQGNTQSAKHKKDVEDLALSEEARAYIACQMELDAALEYILEQLEERGIADRTVIWNRSSSMDFRSSFMDGSFFPRFLRS